MVIFFNSKKYSFEDIVALMDKEICEKLHNEIAPCTAKKFFDAYCKEHLKKFNEEFQIN